MGHIRKWELFPKLVYVLVRSGRSIRLHDTCMGKIEKDIKHLLAWQRGSVNLSTIRTYKMGYKHLLGWVDVLGVFVLLWGQIAICRTRNLKSTKMVICAIFNVRMVENREIIKH